MEFSFESFCRPLHSTLDLSSVSLSSPSVVVCPFSPFLDVSQKETPLISCRAICTMWDYDLVFGALVCFFVKECGNCTLSDIKSNASDFGLKAYPYFLREAPRNFSVFLKFCGLVDFLLVIISLWRHLSFCFLFFFFFSFLCSTNPVPSAYSLLKIYRHLCPLFSPHSFVLSHLFKPFFFFYFFFFY